uniref:FMRFamide receptor (inferred by orthology to a D. melanogaster protein) n=1 Tax=Strongyloides venezuelensis TaxID=75913 RepID=A0A0K0FGZ9_STRVS
MESQISLWEENNMGRSLPPECFLAYNSTYEKFKTVQVGTQNFPINITNCLPVCGFCAVSVPDQTYTFITMLINGVLLPFTGVLGILGNITSAYVYSRPAMKSSTNFYLCALASSDCFIILTALITFWLDIFRNHSILLHQFYGIVVPYVYPMCHVVQFCSVYFTVLAATDGFIQVCLTQKIYSWVSRSSVSIKAVIFVVISSFIYTIPRWLEGVRIGCWHGVMEEASYEICQNKMASQPWFTQTYQGFLVNVITVLIPLTILVFLNICIIGASAMVKSNNTSSRSSGSDNIALILVVLLFIMCNIASYLLNAHEAILLNLLGPSINYLIDTSNMLTVFNSSFNFVIYYVFSSPFRRTLHQYFGSHVNCNGQKHFYNDNNLSDNEIVLSTNKVVAKNVNDDEISISFETKRLDTISRISIIEGELKDVPM